MAPLATEGEASAESGYFINDAQPDALSPEDLAGFDQLPPSGEAGAAQPSFFPVDSASQARAADAAQENATITFDTMPSSSQALVTTTCNYRFTSSDARSDPLPLRNIDNFGIARSILGQPTESYVIAGSRVLAADSETSTKTSNARVQHFLTMPSISPQGTIIFRVAPSGAGRLMTDSRYAVHTGNASSAESSYRLNIGIGNNGQWRSSSDIIDRTLRSTDGVYRTQEPTFGGGNYYSTSTPFLPGQTYSLVASSFASATTSRGLGLVNSAASAASDFGGKSFDIQGDYPNGHTRLTGNQFLVTYQIPGYAANCDGPYADVYASNQFATEIRWMRDNNIAPPYADGTYRPLNATSRADMAYFMWAMRGMPNATGTNCFVDVNYYTINAEQICWAKAVGLVGGWPDNTFRPNEPVARDAMAAFLYRLAGNPNYQGPLVSPFTDVATNNQFYREITWLRHRGISTGWPDGTYRPLQSTNRDAMAAFLYRMRTGGLA